MVCLQLCGMALAVAVARLDVLTLICLLLCSLAVAVAVAVAVAGARGGAGLDILALMLNIGGVLVLRWGLGWIVIGMGAAVQLVVHNLLDALVC